MTNLTSFMTIKLRQSFPLFVLLVACGCEARIVPSQYPTSVNVDDAGILSSMGQPDAGKSNPIIISILTPKPGSLFGKGNLSVTATVVAEVPVFRVNFSVDGKQLAADFEPPYSAVIPVAGLSDGKHTLSISALGYAGESATAELVFEIDATSPQIVLENDLSLIKKLTMTSTVIKGMAIDDRRVTLVELYVDGVSVLSQTEERFEFDYDFRSSGIFRVHVRAVDMAGNESISPEMVYEIDQPPNIAIDTPRMNDLVSGHVLLRASVFDDNGVAKVVWSVDGEIVGEYESAPYSHSWNTCSLAAGIKTIRVSAQDSLGQMSHDEITVRVSNEAEPITLRAAALSKSVKLTWTSCASAPEHSYRLFYSNVPNVSAANSFVDVGQVNSFTDFNLSPKTNIFYRIARVRGSMVVSPLSNELAVTTYGEVAAVVSNTSELVYSLLSLDDVYNVWQYQRSFEEIAWSPNGDDLAVTQTSSVNHTASVLVLTSNGVASSTNTFSGTLPRWSASGEELYLWRSDLQSICRTSVQTSSQACAVESSELSNLRVVYPETEERFCLEVANPDGSMNLWVRDWNGTRAAISSDAFSYEWIRDDTGVVVLVDVGAGLCRLAYLGISASGPQSGYYLVEDVSCSTHLAWSESEQRIYFTQTIGDQTGLYSHGVSSGTISSLSNLAPIVWFEGTAYKLILSHDEEFVSALTQNTAGEFLLQLAPVDGSTVATVRSSPTKLDLVFRPSSQLQP